jgi:hypothetical protein
MSSRPDRLQWLTQQFNDLSASLNSAASPKEKVELLGRMKVVLDEMDGMIFASLRREKESVKSSEPHD